MPCRLRQKTARKDNREQSQNDLLWAPEPREQRHGPQKYHNPSQFADSPQVLHLSLLNSERIEFVVFMESRP